MRLRFVVVVALAVLAGFLAGQAVGLGQSPGKLEPAESSTAAAAQPVAHADAPAEPSTPLSSDLSPEEQRNIEIFRRASASVVFITNIALRRDYFSLDVFQIPQGSGSGIVWDKDGDILTNFHVVQGSSSLKVALSDQSEWDGEIVGTAPNKDIAVIRIKAPASSLVPLPVGRSADLQVGQAVLAVGNPFGLDHSLTIGVVSALGRELESPGGQKIRDVIQTDAAINPGNSGGPLLDSRGRLIGMNSAIYSPSGASAGIGFAVPVDAIKRLVPQLIEHGAPVQAGIGISLLADNYAERLGMKGAIVYDVKKGAPADRAGLEGLSMSRSGRVVVGDVIVGVNGESIESGDDLAHAFETAGVGATITLTVQRDKQKRQVKVTLISLGG